MPLNRRRTPRCLCDLEAEVLGPRGTLRGAVKNLSTGGLFFTGKDLLGVGQSADFEFTIDGQKLRATGEVRFQQRDPSGAASMGVKFIRLEPAALAIIQAFVDRSPKAPDPTEEP
ncbi:MAG: PilZ domain-containing protein [Deltaproteobacteria bacterium]|nr:PilZ domain-containing protein [Deltaproteobacteria bacterium]